MPMGLMAPKPMGGLFGGGYKRPYDTPGIGDGMEQARRQMIANPAEPPQKPKFFGEGGTGRNIAGYIGDALLQMSGMQPIYQPTMMNRAQSAAEMQREEAKRFAGLEDYKLKKQIDQQYDTPEATSFERTLDAAGITGEQRIKLLRQKAENDAMGALVAVDKTNPDGSVERVYMRPGSMGGGQAPAAPVGKLRPIGVSSQPAQGGNIVTKADAAKLKAAYGEGPYRAWLQKFGLQEEQ